MPAEPSGALRRGSQRCGVVCATGGQVEPSAKPGSRGGRRRPSETDVIPDPAPRMALCYVIGVPRLLSEVPVQGLPFPLEMSLFKSYSGA